jgi:death-on-curing family protein
MTELNPENQAIFYFSNQQKEIQLPIIIDAQNDTVWVTNEQMKILFDKARKTISEHIANIYKEGELEKSATWRKNRQVQKEGNREVEREVDEYNLDVLISVGYRVKSLNGILFRNWANEILKSYLLNGFAINKELLSKKEAQIEFLQQKLDNIREQYFAEKKELTTGFINIIDSYHKTFDLLYKYDANELNLDNLNDKIIYTIKYEEAKQAIAKLKQSEMNKKRASELFGNEKDNSFQGCLGSISQTVFGQLAYPTIEEQAAQLLYSILKNHCFSDGNKRIASYMFIVFLEKNNFHLDKDKKQKISENTLITLTLMVAQSLPEQRELMLKLIINLLK